jgi:hypothetical protein
MSEQAEAFPRPTIRKWLAGEPYQLHDLVGELRAALDYFAPALVSPGGEKDRRELLCQRCDREYATWSAPNDLWNRVVRDHGGDGYGDDPYRDTFLCPSCFAMLAEARGIQETPYLLVPVLWLDDETRERLARVTHWPVDKSARSRVRIAVPWSAMHAFRTTSWASAGTTRRRVTRAWRRGLKQRRQQQATAAPSTREDDG